VLGQLPYALSCKRNQLLRAHHENIHATRKPAIPSLPSYLTLLEAFVMSLEEKKISMASVREQTIPTERPPLVGEVITNFCG
jgi:hypothetical protein